MSKKEDDIDLDNFDLDEFDFDFDTSPPESEVPEGREAVAKIAGKTARGAANAIAGVGRREKLIVDSLPNDYGVAYETYDVLRTEGREVMREAREQLAKVQLETKRATRQAMPIVKRYLPERLTKPLDEWASSEMGGYSDYDPQQAQIDAVLGDIRATQPNSLPPGVGVAEARQQREEEIEERVESDLKEQSDIVRTNRMIQLLAGIQKETATTAAFENSVGVSYRRKMLEINYRQYFALNDMLDLTRQSMDKIIPGVELIANNTALPDYAKEEFGEITAAKMKRQIIDQLSPANFAQNYYRLIGANTRNAISDFFGSATDAIKGVGDAASMAAMDADAGDSNTGDLTKKQKATKAAMTGAGFAGEWIANRYVRPHVEKAQAKLKDMGEKHEGVASFGKKLRHTASSLPETLNTYAKNPFHDGKDASVMGVASLVLQDILGRFDGEQVGLDDRTGEALSKSKGWSSHNDLTLNEIIPGLLTKIDQSIRVGFGDTNTSLEQYDMQSRTFVSTDEIDKRIREEVSQDDANEYLRQEIDKLVELLADGQDMSNEDRETIGRVIDEKIRKVERFDIDDLATSPDGYGTVGYGRNVFDLISHFDELTYDKELKEDLNVQVGDRIRQLRQYVPSIQKSVDEMRGKYGESALVRSGVFERDGEFLSPQASLQSSFEKLPEYVGQAKLPNRNLQAPLQIGVDKEEIQKVLAGVAESAKDVTDARSSFKDMASTLRQAVNGGVYDALYNRENDDNLYKVMASVAKDAETPEERDEALSPLLEAIHQQLVENNTTVQLETILERLDVLAKSGIKVTNIDADFASEKVNAFKAKAQDLKDKATSKSKSFFSKAETSFKEKKEKAKKTFARKTAGFAFNRAKNVYGLGKATAKGAWEQAKKTPERFARHRKFFANKIPPLAGVAKDTITSTARGVWNGITGNKDIYDKDGNIVLFGRKLKAKEYFDKAGKVIENIKDIKGAVYDKYGEVVLSEEEVKSKFKEFTHYVNGGWKKVTEAAGSFVGERVANVAGFPKKVLAQMNGRVAKIKRGATTACDIYVEGEDQPRLLRSLMLKGYYISKRSGKPIYMPDDVDGEVITRDGNVVISADDLARPGFKLVDVHGNEIKSPIGKAVDIAKKAAGLAVKAALLPYKLAKKGTAAMMGGVGKLKGKLGGEDTSIGGKLDKIYKLLDERMPGGKVKGDADGDGVRDNSFRDIFAKRKAARAAKAAEKKAKKGKDTSKNEKDDSSGVLSMLGSAATFFGSKLLGVFTTGMSGILTALGVGGTILKGLGTVGKGLGGLAWGGTKLAGKGVLAAGKGVGSVIRGAGTVASFVGRQVLWNGARALAAGAISAVSAPWLLAGAAIGAVGYGVYSLATRKTAYPIDSLRFAQYGVEDYDREDKEQVEKLRFLEAEVGKFTTYDKAGIASIREINEDTTRKLAAGIEVDIEDQEAFDEFRKWMYGRFLQVYMLWASRARQFAPGVAFIDIGNPEKVEPKVQLKILNGCSLRADHPIYEVVRGPFSAGMFDDAWDGTKSFFGGDKSPNLLSGNEVLEIEAEVREELAKMIKKRAKKPKPKKDTATISGVTPWYEKGLLEVKKNKDGTVEVDGKKFDSLLQWNVKRVSAREAAKASTTNKSSEIAHVTSDSKKTRNASDVNAIDAIRLKTYGITILHVDHVAALYSLEDEVLKYITVTSGRASFRGSASEIADLLMPKFGLDASNDEHRTRWISWFQYRFIPVMLAYMTAVKKYAPNARPFDIVVSSSAGFLVDVANETIAARTKFEGKEQSVWGITLSPFKDLAYLASSNAALQDNLEYLRSIRKDAVAMEQKKSDVKISGVDFSKKETKENTTKPKPRTRHISGSTDAMIDAIFGDSSKTDYNTGAGSIPIGASSKDAVNPDGAYANVAVSGKGRASMADLIKQVADITGVDPNLLLTVGMMESSLNPDAGAAKGSAKGLFQFIDGTWKEMMGKHANQYGIPSDATPYDPVANALLGAEYIRLGIKSANAAVNREATPVDIYLSHFLGPGGMRKFLSNMEKDPSAIAWNDFPAEAQNNAPVFAPNGRPASYSQIYNRLMKRARSNYSHIAEYTEGVEERMDEMNHVSKKPLANMSRKTTTAISMPDMSMLPKDVKLPKPKRSVDTLDGEFRNLTTQQVQVNNDGSATFNGKTYDSEHEASLERQKLIKKAYSSIYTATTPTPAGVSGVKRGTVANDAVRQEASAAMQHEATTRGQILRREAIAKATSAPTSSVDNEEAVRNSKSPSRANYYRDNIDIDQLRDAEKLTDIENDMNSGVDMSGVEEGVGVLVRQNAEIGKGQIDTSKAQLTTQQETNILLNNILKKLSGDMTEREVKQIDRDTMAEVQQLRSSAPTIEHGESPINVSRIR